jgi:IgGFc binding protein
MMDRSKRRFAGAAVLIGWLVAASGHGAACSAAGSNFTGTAGGAGAGSSSSGSGTGAGGLIDFDASSGSGGGSGCALCSADLKSVIDCSGNVVMTCAAGEACAGGVCGMDPCQAAVEGQSTYGCEYWALNLDNILPGACFAAYVTNTFTVPIHIAVDYKGAQQPVEMFTRIPTGQGSGLTYAPYSSATGLMPGQVAILFLSQSPQLPFIGAPCPSGITPAITVDPAVHGTGLGDAFHITTDGPVVAYQIFPYGGGSAAITSATLLLPTSAWDVNYVAVNAYAASEIMNNPNGLPSLDVVAEMDGTTVTISPVAAITGGTGVAATAKGQPATYNLSKGQYVQFTQTAELTGSPILANNPVAVFGGNACMNVPANFTACDTGEQQIPPVRALGHEYVGVRYRGRAGGTDESVPWRIIGAVAGTTLTYTPSTPMGAPTTLSPGQVAEFDSPGPFIVASQDAQHPFYMAAFMTGGQNFNGEGDPEFVNVVPTAQYLDSYTFFTDPTYPETNLVLVRTAGANGFEDVTLDCSGTVTGWTPIGPYEYARVDLVTGNFQSVGGCANGTHLISSKAPFGVTVWGWGSAATVPYNSQWVSYAYPAGAGVKPVNTTIVPPNPQ